MEELKELDVCFGKVLHLDEAFKDPQVVHRKMVTEFDDAKKGKMKLLSSPIKMSETPPDIRKAPADFGEHTEEVLKELGFQEIEMAEKRRGGVKNSGRKGSPKGQSAAFLPGERA